MDGNNVVIKDSSGARELTVPDDFRFTVDGKPTSVHDLKAGMKGTAAVTTTTTTRPVYVTTVKKGTVVRQAGTSVWVKTDDGTTRKFTKSEIDARGIKIIMDGKPTRLVDLKAGDTLSATIVTPAPPEVLTQKDVQAVLDAPRQSSPPRSPLQRAYCCRTSCRRTCCRCGGTRGCDRDSRRRAARGYGYAGVYCNDSGSNDARGKSLLIDG